MATSMVVHREIFRRVFLHNLKNSGGFRKLSSRSLSRRLHFNSKFYVQAVQVRLSAPSFLLARSNPFRLPQSSCSYSTQQDASDTPSFTETPVLTGSEVPETLTTAQDVLQAVQEVPFSELGLGGYWPIGILQSSLEWLHMSAGLPWWASIIAATVIARTLLFPVIIRNQRLSIKFNNVMPKFQSLTMKLNEAKRYGNHVEVTWRNMELQRFVKKHDINPLKTMMGPMVQAPIFISFFIGLRRMAQLPVESMTVGGMLWFTDLTIPDPYYALPVLASLSMFAVIRLGAETGVSTPQMEKMKKFIQIMPFAILPLIVSMPQAVFMYWLTSNAFSLGQVALLKVPAVRTALNIPVANRPDPAATPKSEGFFKDIKSGWDNAKTQYEQENQAKSQAEALRQSGTGPVPQTFARDPTRPQPVATKSTSASSKPVRRKVR